ncbi:MAG: peptidylprolyl isomerase [Pelomonas sp.]|nr:peptidylprolyl isomerase [Roseateles sp.]
MNKSIATSFSAVAVAALLAFGIAVTSPALAATTKHKAKAKPAAAPPAAAASQPQRSPAEILKDSPARDWRGLDPQNTLVMELPQGRVIIELAARFAPHHAANIRALAHEGYFDELAILRVQDNFVTQWGDPNADDAKLAKPLGAASPHLPAEFSVALKGLPLTELRETDGWAPRNGFVDGFPVAADPRTGRAWLAHCYGMVGAGRADTVDSSTGAELYAVIGQAPRALDLNITVVGRVLQGIEFLAALPRGGANMGFYDQPEQRTTIKRVQLLADLPEAERPALQVLRTDSPTFAALLEARRHRSGWYVHSPERVDLCSATVPTRPTPGAAMPTPPAAPASAASAP